jgi:hypothetical protein
MQRCVPSLVELPPPLPPPPREDTNVLALVKGTERYVFLYDDKSRGDTLRVLGRYASNPDLSFTWFDAAMLSQKVRAARAAKATCQRADL